ncbi:MAG: response regulator [Provencibacterium sp.]|jgi:two-component system response regulator YesN|nr:response regulator [Provencibacterium sp.]
MYSMLIADDEKVIRESIRECVDWAEHGIHVVGCCANGLEALETVFDESPDIILTDIKMPGLSGLELIEKIQAIDQETELIIISGYREFEFAKKAMEYGVRRYLLKPINEAQLLDAVEDAKRCCQEKRSIQEAVREREQLRRQMDQYNRKMFLYDLFLPGKRREEAVEDYQRHFPVPSGNYYLCSCTGPRPCDMAAYNARLRKELDKKGVSLIADILYTKDSLLALCAGDGPFSWEELSSVTRMGMELESWVFPADGLLDCVRQVEQCLAGRHRVTAVDEEGKPYEVYDTGVSSEKLQQFLNQLSPYLDQEGEEERARLIRGFFSSIEDLLILRTYAANFLSRLFLQYPPQGSAYLSGAFDEIYREKEPENIIDILISRTRRVVTDQNAHDDLIKKVKECIARNLSDSNLSLKQIADQYVHVNVDYLSRLFAQKTGEKFSHYLNRIRVERAKELLLQEGCTVSFVAEQVGYGHNPRYFGQIFKKYSGMTPTAYLETVGKGA